MTGKSVMIPGLTMGNLATDSMADDEMVRNIMERHYLLMKEFRMLEFSGKLRKANKTRSKGYEDIIIDAGDLVFYQYEDKKAWLGPEKVFAVNGGDIFIFANGNLRKVPRCNVQLSEKKEEIEKDETEGNVSKVTFEEKDSEAFGEEVEDQDIEEVSKIMTRSMTDAKRKEMRRDEISTFWMQVENSECFDEIVIYTVEVPVREHKLPEVIDAKQKEIENLEKYGVFEEIEDEGQETVYSRWVITRKEKSDGQKQKVKGRLVAKGFQEKEAPQSDWPTMLRVSIKMFFTLVANEDFELRKIDIRAAFIQAKKLDRDVF